MINNSKKITIILFVLLMMTLVYFPTIVFGAKYIEDAKNIFSIEVSCVCPIIDGYTNENGTKLNPATTHCLYKDSDGTSVERACNLSASDDVIKKYISAGVFGQKCYEDLMLYPPVICEDAKKFKSDAEFYATNVQVGLETKTRTENYNVLASTQETKSLGDAPLRAAMTKFNENAHLVYSFLIGFGFLTALLVFILIFMKIAWLPDHPIKRREAMEDIVTSGISVILLGGIWLFVSLLQSVFDRFWASYAVYSKDWVTVGNMFLYEYKQLITGFLGIATLTVFLMLIKNFVGLTLSGDNPQARKQKMIGILLVGIAAAGLGGLTIFVSFFWGMLGK